MSEDVPLEISCCCARIVALLATIRLFSWMGSHVDSKTASCCARVVALWTNKRFLSAVNSHVDSKMVSCCARVVALWTNKRFLSAVNAHVVFQIGKFATRVAALIAIVIFLCIRLDLVDFGHLRKFWFMICVFSVCWRLQSIGITEKNKVIWPGPFHEVARYNDDDDDDDRNIYLRNEYL